ncbi:MAG TPA: hypothetical protein VFL13_00495 [Candidatus Baltobacteraceae bacterium]|nr:hypothetical protein [Candidatus Baltobacteraceae bacterium]
MSEIGKAIKNVGDAVDEGIHRGEAAGERAKRDVAGDAMTPGEKLGSVANEVKRDVQADMDKAKRNIREST